MSLTKQLFQHTVDKQRHDMTTRFDLKLREALVLIEVHRKPSSEVQLWKTGEETKKTETE